MTSVDSWDWTHESPETKAQVERDLASGRLRYADTEAQCDEVSAQRTGPNRQCGRDAAMFDSTRNRNQCKGHVLNHAKDRAHGYEEYPLLEVGSIPPTPGL